MDLFSWVILVVHLFLTYLDVNLVREKHLVRSKDCVNGIY